LDRIISASSNEGDLVADFFCGCGTTIASAERLNRSWIGVDISHLAIRLIVDRLTKPYPDKAKQQRIRESIEISGLPKDIASAKELARGTEGGRLAFQDWVIEVLLGGVSNTKKTADGGFDGYMTFSISEKVRELVLIEVKSGNVNVKNIREFIEVVEARKAAIGVFVCFDEQVTKPMLHEAKKQGYYDEATWGQSFDKIQIITVEDLLAGEGLRAPESTRTTFKAAKLKPTKSSPGNSLFDK
jgi:site-specific DNA-methyltransferase (adenine-specific)